jgi:hypothetical protein
MISVNTADLVMVCSLLVTLIAYVRISRMEGSYINVLVPVLIMVIPACYFFPWLYLYLFGTRASTYAFVYVYTTLAVENMAFVYAYTRARERVIRLPGAWSYRNFTFFSLACLITGVFLYLPILFEFREDLLDPRRIYEQTRTGFGLQFYVSSFLAYLAVILILFTQRSRLIKVAVIIVAALLLVLHGSKGHVLNLVLLLVLFHVYGANRKVGLARTLMACSAIGLVVILLFAGTMSLGEGAQEVLEAISEYSDYTRNATMVIDEHFPLQYGRLTFEANTLALVPRALMPNKPKDLGGLLLDEEFYPELLDADAGAPSFGMGVQYADFGSLAMAYLAVCALLRGWLARVFVNRLKSSKHPADFFMIAFLADVSLFPVGGLGWFITGAILVALLLRWISTIGAGRIYRDRQKRPVLIAASEVAGARQWEST